MSGSVFVPGMAIGVPTLSRSSSVHRSLEPMKKKTMSGVKFVTIFRKPSGPSGIKRSIPVTASGHQSSELADNGQGIQILSSDLPKAPTDFLLHKEKNQLWKFSATPEKFSQDIVSSDSSSEAIVSSGGGQDGVALIIQVLLILAFLALTVLTIGVVYIGVTEFLGKREREKFEKDEAAKRSKKGGKMKAMRAKAGPRGFGQKIEDDDIDVDLE